MDYLDLRPFKTRQHHKKNKMQNLQNLDKTNSTYELETWILLKSDERLIAIFERKIL